MGDVFRAGTRRQNVALLLARQGRFSDALLYARAALTNFESFGDHAADRITQAQELIAQIKGLQAKHRDNA